MQRHAAFMILFGSGDFGAAQAATAFHPDALRAKTHRVLHRSLHRAPEANTALQLLGDILGNKGRVDLRLTNLDDV